MSKRFGFDNLERSKLIEMSHWKEKDVKGIKKNAYIKEIKKKNNNILTVTEKTHNFDVILSSFLNCRSSIAYRNFEEKVFLNLDRHRAPG